MNEKKVKILLADEDDNILRRSGKVVLKWTNEFEQALKDFHNKNGEEEVINLVFSNIMDSMERIGITEEEKEEIKNTVIKCEKCNKLYMGFTGLDINVEDQPCPHCHDKGE